MPKIILHVDFNSFFASVEQQANPFLRGRAIAVAGKGKHSLDVAAAHKSAARLVVDQLSYARSVVTTASREAKKQGVKTAMATWQARKLCPELMIIPGDPRKYSEVTSRMVAILKRHCDTVEVFSTDEAFADITTAAQDMLGATLIAQRIRQDIKEWCGEYCTASIGVAPNKLIAKLASESVKPNGLTLVKPEDAEYFVLTRPLKEFCGIGFRIEKHLARLGATSVATLRELPLPLLLHEFKSYGAFLYAAARGMGDDIVNGAEEPPKSVGHSYTFPKDLLTDSEVRCNLLALADRVAWRMRRQHLAATHLSVYVRYGDFSGDGAGKQFKEPIIDGLQMADDGWRLMKETIQVARGVRLLGITASGLIGLAGAQPLLQENQKKQRLLQALDKVTERYGSGTWERASTLPTSFKERVSGWHYDHKI